ncbi:MAG: DinB family protein, partial [Gemmatimonadota bacterium]|nr:DinB family protein [Gemmatimonadota bacterium]
MKAIPADCTESIARYLLESTRRALEPLRAALDLVPDERLGEQPVPDQLPVGRMIEHAFGAVAFTARALRFGKFEESDAADLMVDDEATGTRPRIDEMEKVALDELRATLEALSADMASRTIDYFFGWSLTGVETARLGYEELCHHRGQVQSFLRL